MSTMQQDALSGVFENLPVYFQQFSGQIVTSSDLKNLDSHGKHIAIVGLNQSIASQLDKITQQAEHVYVFQIQPHFVLPSTERVLQRIINHPLISKNRAMINHRIKNLLSVRFLESQVNNLWLRRQLTPNLVGKNKIYLKSDHFYQALQRENCTLITWPIHKISGNAIHCIQGQSYPVDMIISTWKDEKTQK